MIQVNKIKLSALSLALVSFLAVGTLSSCKNSKNKKADETEKSTEAQHGDSTEHPTSDTTKAGHAADSGEHPNSDTNQTEGASEAEHPNN